MRYLATVERKGMFGSPVLQLLSKQVDELCWTGAHGEVSDPNLTKGHKTGDLVIAHISASQKLLRLEAVTEPLLATLHELSDYIRHSMARIEEVENWKQSIALQSEELHRREASMTEVVNQFNAKEQLLLPARSDDALFSRKNNAARRRKQSVNVMEKLVIQEFEVQISRLPGSVQALIDRTDVEVWALNRLPAFYATGLRGTRMMEERILEGHREQIVQTVREGIEVIHRNEQPPDEPSHPEAAPEEATPASQSADSLSSSEI